MATLAEMLRQGADKLINLPSEAQRFVTNPQAFTQLLTGKNPMPRETGFAAGATGLPAQEMSVLDPNQAPYMQGYTHGEPIGYAGIAAPFAAPAAVATAKALAPKLGQVTENYMVKQGMIQPLTAYHGTPHTIQGQFDINKVGTGEGAQAYGHGMYFAESPSVAQGYAKTLGQRQAGYEIDGVRITPERGSIEDMAVNLATGASGVNAKNPFEYAKNRALGLVKQNPQMEQVAKKIEELQSLGANLKTTGNLYKVDIPDEYIPNMLFWDKPLSQQPKAVQEALAKYDPNMYGPKSADYDSAELGQSIYQRLVAEESKKARELVRNGQFIEDTSKYGFQNASKRLNEIGVKGIRYLDEGSRSAGKGTSNFVVFEPSTVKILEQNSKPVTRKELIQQQIDKIE